LHPLFRWQELFLRSHCLLCDRPAPQSLCPGCDEQFQTDILPHPEQLQTHQHNQILAWGRYQNRIRRLLSQLKYENRPEIGYFLGQQLAQSWLHHQLPRLPVVPIPLNADRQAQRGYNQAELIARSFAQYTGVKLLPLLNRPKATTAQYGLTLSDRQNNLANAFHINPKIARPISPILLIDDIYTSGTTITIAQQTLHQAQIRTWGAAIIARPPFT
jgi:ComF family protein